MKYEIKPFDAQIGVPVYKELKDALTKSAYERNMRRTDYVRFVLGAIQSNPKIEKMIFKEGKNVTDI